MSKFSSELFFPRDTNPYNTSWEKWAANWCNWFLSIPKKNNPSLDSTGKNCAQNQIDPHVWFLGGSFGNESVIKRRCIIPKTRGIFFPIIEKEDSFVEDTDLKTEEELVERAKQAMDGVTLLEARIDGNYIEELKRYRVGSDFYDLIFPDDNVYDLVPGLTRSVCNGYWIFLKPLPVGKHNIYFHGECLLEEDDRANQRINSDKVYAPMRKFVREFRRFKVEVEYELTIQ